MLLSFSFPPTIYLLALVRELLLQTQLIAVATGLLTAIGGTGGQRGIAPIIKRGAESQLVSQPFP